MYDLRFSPQAEKDLEQLDSQAYGQVVARLWQLRELGPDHPGLERLSGQYRDQLRLRAGSWRIRLRDLPEENRMVIIRIPHRSRIYKR